MKQTKVLRTLLMSASAISGMAFVEARAQDIAMADTGDAKADAIIVTGTRRETTIQDATINLQAISAEEMQAKNIEDIRDLAAFTPGMSVPDTGPRSTGQVILRGLTADSLGSFGANFDDSLAVYLGETPLYQDLKFIDISRVETLLGPQGTLYGRGTLSGAIRYIPNRPEAGELDFGVRASAYDVAHGGSVGYTGEGFVNIPVFGDKVALRSVVGYYSDPGFIDYPFLVREPGVSDPQPGTGYDLGTPEDIEANLYREKDVNFEETFTTRNVIGIYPTEWLTAYLTYAHQETETDGRQANGDGIFGSGKYEGPWRYLEPSDRTSDLYSVEIEADIFGFAKMVSATAWTKQEAKSSADVTDLLLDLDYDYELFPAFAGFTQSEQKREQFNAELRFVSTHDGPVSWVLGGFYNKMLYDSDYVEILPGMSGFFGVTRPDEIEYASYVDSKDEEAAVFGEVSIEVLPGLEVTGGGRYYSYTSYIDGGTTLPLWNTYLWEVTGGVRGYPDPEIRFRSRSGDTSADGFVWKGNVSYKFTDDILAYFTYSKGYRIGGVNRVAPCVLPLDPDVQNLCALPNELSYEPDTVHNKEIGIRSTLFDGMLVSNLALYHLGWDGIQLGGQTVNGAIGITVNGGTAVSKGVEWSFAFTPTEDITIQGSYNFLDAYLTQDVPELLQYRAEDGTPTPTDVYDGDRLPGTPKHSGALGVTYVKPLANGAELSMNWTSTYLGDVLSRVGERAYGEKLSAYSVSQAYVTYAFDKWKVSLYATNIFDKYAVTSIGEDRSRIFLNDGVASRYFSQNVLSPRKIGVKAAYNF